MKKLAIACLLAALALVTAACRSSSSTDVGKVIKSAPVGNNLTATLSNKDGVLKNGDNVFFVSFKDGSGKTVDVGAVGLTFYFDGNDARDEQRGHVHHRKSRLISRQSKT